MKINFRKLFFRIMGMSVFVASTAQASMMAMCNNTPTHTQYICCPSAGGWIVSNACNAGASPHCVNDTGLIAGTDTSILQDCQNRGGNAVQYIYDGAQGMPQGFDGTFDGSQDNLSN